MRSTKSQFMATNVAIGKARSISSFDNRHSVASPKTSSDQLTFY